MLANLTPTWSWSWKLRQVLHTDIELYTSAGIHNSQDYVCLDISGHVGDVGKERAYTLAGTVTVLEG